MITYIIIGLTCITSIFAFNSEQVKRNLMFYPYSIKRMGEYYRFLSSGFIHADWMHLIFNMFVLYGFGLQVESVFHELFGNWSNLFYLMLYFGGMIVADIATYLKHNDHSYYRSLGASGAVSAVLFSYILFAPWSTLFIFPIPIPIPAVVLGVGYLIYSYYAAQKAQDNVNHDAHLLGAIFGIVFTIALKPNVGLAFIKQLTGGGM